MTLEKIVLVGEDGRRQELLKRLPNLPLLFQGELPPSYEMAESADIFIDLDLDDHPERLPFYLKQETTLMASAVKMSLLQQRYTYMGPVASTLLGLNALPTFIDRPVWEVCALDEEGSRAWKEIAQNWNIEIEEVAARPGMVTPRIILPIINEAYIMWQEGTAGPDAIDTAMKLGTNYPRGPIAWSREIGLSQVVELLEILHRDTGSQRFMPCRLLREKSMIPS